MIKLNLLPKNLRRRVEPGWWRLAAAAVVLAVLGTVGFLHFSTLGQLNAKQNELEALQVEVNVLRPFIGEQNRLNQQQKDLESILAVRNQLQSRYVPWSKNINAFAYQLPGTGGKDELQLRTISTKSLNAQDTQSKTQTGAYDGKPVNVEFTVQGEAKTQAAVVRFIEAFETSPNFGISLDQVQFDEQREFYTFGATIGMVSPSSTASTGGENGSSSR